VTKAARERSYHVLLHALAEERRVCGMSDEIFSRRSQEIWDDCFKKDPDGWLKAYRAAIAKAEGGS
jgi:hypothetical protein